ncbi:hypothetical protein [Williamsoniiplasma lucivorax]|uniref:Uncharacterized protein n=1 Tax=Williamsoniiplasma lucivorax TaxID=209274 RepID=A0A2S5RFK4_9MOLU|nr:hypothetical protein [Williamsoniiplasma lucivorax]PPE05915.1 hypothetical protein ELUCI_v1c02050 [Williamsoniiplasma lucivorax]
MKLTIILSSGLMSASPVSATIPQIVQKNNVDTNAYLTSILPILNTEINNKNQEQIKQIFLNALRINNNSLFLDKEQIKQIKNEKLINIFLSNQFSQQLNNLFTFKIIVFQNNKFNFNSISNHQTSNTRGFWLEEPWYWFGYAKFHFDDQLTKSLAFEFSNVYTKLEAKLALLGLIPELKSCPLAADAMAVTLFNNGGTNYINSVNSAHKGIWFSSWGFMDAYGPWSE